MQQSNEASGRHQSMSHGVRLRLPRALISASAPSRRSAMACELLANFWLNPVHKNWNRYSVLVRIGGFPGCFPATARIRDVSRVILLDEYFTEHLIQHLICARVNLCIFAKQVSFQQ
jgi:hypothetical protein